MQNEENCQVNSLRNNHTWTFNSLHVPLPTQLEHLTRGILVAQITRLPDSFVWPHNNGICSVSSASKFLYQQKQVPLDKQLWNWIWKLQCPKKIQLFLWKAMLNQVPTRQYLAFSRLNINEQCPRCNNPETTIHILRDCHWAKEAQDQSPGILPLSFFHMPLQAWLRCSANVEQCYCKQCNSAPATPLENIFSLPMLEFMISQK